MSSDVRAENLGILIDAIEAIGAGGIVRAEGFRWEPSQTQRLARRVGATSRVVELAEPTLPPGGIWLVIARALGTTGSGDPRRQVRRGIAEAMRLQRTTLLVVGQAAQLPAATLASLIATAQEEPGLRLLLFVEADESLAGPLPDSVRTTLPYTPATAPPKPAPSPAPKLDPPPTPILATAAKAPARPTPAIEPRATTWRIPLPLRVVAPAAIAIAAGWFWWHEDTQDVSMASETPTTSEAARLPEVAAAPLPAPASATVSPPSPRPSATPSVAPTALPDAANPSGASPGPRPEAPTPEPAIKPAPSVVPVPVGVAEVTPGPDMADRAGPPASVSAPAPAADSAPTPLPPVAADASLSAPININAYPWARIEIGGRTIGETPIGELRLPRGSHDVRAVFADGSSRVRRVRADDNERFIMFGTPAR